MSQSMNNYPSPDDMPESKAESQAPLSTIDAPSRQATSDMRARKTLTPFAKMIVPIVRRSVEKMSPLDTLQETAALGRSVLRDGMDHQEDGGVPLVGGDYYLQRLKTYAAQELPFETTDRIESERNRGVAAALWGLGFVQFRGPEHLEQGLGGSNPDIEWSEGADGTVRATLPYNAGNDFHRMLAEDSGQTAPPRGLELVAAPVAGDPRLDELGLNQRLDLRIVAG